MSFLVYYLRFVPVRSWKHIALKSAKSKVCAVFSDFSRRRFM